MTRSRVVVGVQERVTEEEGIGLARLRSLDHLKAKTLVAIASDRLKDAQPIVTELKDIYAPRADLSRACLLRAGGKAPGH